MLMVANLVCAIGDRECLAIVSRPVVVGGGGGVKVSV